ncbi:endonuclease domain-containing protein [Hymenobacter sp. 5516J-16]|nr:endonuclease domain-containing protein [Hymenobacter sp. 5516J-16]
MRSNPTAAEDALWQALRNNQLGVKFRRQHVIGTFIVDFVCVEAQLIVEVDGDVHRETGQAEHDAGRTHELTELGYHVLRFHNDEVLHHLPHVLLTIQQHVSFLTSTSRSQVAAVEAEAETAALPNLSGSPLSTGEGAGG